MSCFRIYDTNFIDLDKISEQVASSENVSFPVINTNNKQRRSKVWRTDGYFEVTASNNEIVFEETGSTPLTATITVGEYTSITAMVAAVKSALDTAGGSVYTVSNSTATGFKFRIASDGAGGGGILNLLWSDAGSTAASLLGFDTNDLTGALTYDADFLRINSGEFILWDMGISTIPTGFAMIGPRNSPIGVSPDSVIKLQGNITDTFTSPIFETTLTYNSKSMLYENGDGISTQPLRYWRVLFEDQNPKGYIEIGAFLLGTHYNPTRGRVQFPLASSYVDRSTTVFSEGGQTFSDIKPKSQEFSVGWSAIQKLDVENLDILFDDFGTHTPFFVSMDAGAVFSTSSQRSLRFVKFSSPPSYQLISPDNFNVTMNFREEL